MSAKMSAQSAPLLIVDGHNALLGLDRFTSEERIDAETARESLVDWLSRYQGLCEDAVVIVFDGQGQALTSCLGDEDRAMVLYARAGQSADAVIERLAMEQAGKRRVMVATNDRMIQYSVSDHGADFLPLEGLELRVETQLSSLRRAWNVEQG